MCTTEIKLKKNTNTIQPKSNKMLGTFINIREYK